MESRFVYIPIDQLKEIFLYDDPCTLARKATVNTIFDDIIHSKDVLYQLAMIYQLPYEKDITLEELCKFYKMDDRELGIEAIKREDIRVLKGCIERGYKDYNDMLYFAAEYGMNDVVKWLIELGADNVLNAVQIVYYYTDII